MIFAPEWCDRIAEGRKTVTRRPANGEPCPHRVGSIQKVQPGQGQPSLRGRMLITSIRMEKLVEVTGADAKREGYGGNKTRERFIQSFLARYPVSLEAPVYRIEFVYVSAD